MAIIKKTINLKQEKKELGNSSIQYYCSEQDTKITFFGITFYRSVIKHE